MTDDLPALDRYRIHADRLGKRFQMLASEHVLRSVAAFLPAAPSDILDIGAGSGRDACRFAALGHRVTAVEPVREMSSQARRLPGADRVTWIEDYLPRLALLGGRTFDLCLLSAVWHHLSPAQRPPSLARFAELTRPTGRLVMSLRLGPDTDEKTNFAIDTDTTVRQARDAGFTLVHQASNPSSNPKNIALGVIWEWLVFEPKEMT